MFFDFPDAEIYRLLFHFTGHTFTGERENAVLINARILNCFYQCVFLWFVTSNIKVICAENILHLSLITKTKLKKSEGAPDFESANPSFSTCFVKMVVSKVNVQSKQYYA